MRPIAALDWGTSCDQGQGGRWRVAGGSVQGLEPLGKSVQGMVRAGWLDDEITDEVRRLRLDGLSLRGERELLLHVAELRRVFGVEPVSARQARRRGWMTAPRINAPQTPSSEPKVEVVHRKPGRPAWTQSEFHNAYREAAAWLREHGDPITDARIGQAFAQVGRLPIEPRQIGRLVTRFGVPSDVKGQ